MDLSKVRNRRILMNVRNLIEHWPFLVSVSTQQVRFLSAQRDCTMFQRKNNDDDVEDDKDSDNIGLSSHWVEASTSFQLEKQCYSWRELQNIELR